MNGEYLRQARLNREWSQQQAARRLRVSQTYLSMLERNQRSVPDKLADRVRKIYGLPPTAIPLSPEVGYERADADEMAKALAALGYPGFAYLRSRVKRNPAELLLIALMQPDLDSRVVEALPWLVVHYVEMDWNWLLRNARLHDLQNRLGFVVTLAGRIAEGRNDPERLAKLAYYETLLDRSRLAREDTLCHDALSEAERRWLREHRSREARHWNLLTDLSAEHLTHAA